jgi:hypothetical protein
VLEVAPRLQGPAGWGAGTPYVGLAVFEAPAEQPSRRCSASLLSPTVALTAGHWTDGTAVARVWFDENIQNNSEYLRRPDLPTRASRTHLPRLLHRVRERAAGLRLSRRRIIVLTEPVPTSVISGYAQLPSGGLVNELSSKAPLTLVGYGTGADHGRRLALHAGTWSPRPNAR